MNREILFLVLIQCSSGMEKTILSAGDSEMSKKEKMTEEEMGR